MDKVWPHPLPLRCPPPQAAGRPPAEAATTQATEPPAFAHALSLTPCSVCVSNDLCFGVDTCTMATVLMRHMPMVGCPKTLSTYEVVSDPSFAVQYGKGKGKGLGTGLGVGVGVAMGNGKGGSLVYAKK
mgnify:CR=1 FL=1